MPVSNDNQDYGKSEEKNKEEKNLPVGDNKLTSDDLKGKKIDADLEREPDKPGEQNK